MHDKWKIPSGLQLTGWIVVGVLAYASFRDLGDWLVYKAWRGHETVVKIAAFVLCAVPGVAAWLNVSPEACPRWLTRSRLIWVGAVCGFLGLLLISPFNKDFITD